VAELPGRLLTAVLLAPELRVPVLVRVPVLLRVPVLPVPVVSRAVLLACVVRGLASCGAVRPWHRLPLTEPRLGRPRAAEPCLTECRLTEP
jgi:hypothetical protein